MAGLGGVIGVIIVGFKEMPLFQMAGLVQRHMFHSVKTKHPASEGVVILMKRLLIQL